MPVQIASRKRDKKCSVILRSSPGSCMPVSRHSCSLDSVARPSSLIGVVFLFCRPKALTGGMVTVYQMLFTDVANYRREYAMVKAMKSVFRLAARPHGATREYPCGGRVGERKTYWTKPLPPALKPPSGDESQQLPGM